MTDKEIKLNYSQIVKSLSDRELKKAFAITGKLISAHGIGHLYDEYLNLENTYRLMLKYTVEGINDPERQQIYRKLIVSLFQIADKLNEALQMNYSGSFVMTKKRAIKNLLTQNLNTLFPDQLTLYSNESGYRNKIRLLFYRIWLTDTLSKNDSKNILNFISNSTISEHYRALIVTSVMLSLQRYFDQEKFFMLFKLSEVTETEINQRSVVGLLINLYKYDNRLQFYPEIIGNLKIMTEDPSFRNNCEKVITQFIRSKETEKLQKRIKDEILPEMIKISPTLKNKIDLDSLMEEGFSDDKNPDWHDIFKDNPTLLDKMEEFSELQMKGSDVFMGSFSMLKSFPFFSEADNWFIKFFSDNPEIDGGQSETKQPFSKIIEAISNVPVLCNSDKYSFSLSLKRMPESNMEFMKNALQAETDQFIEIESDETIIDPARKKELVSNQIIQDLYRFYKLFPNKSDFEDIFKWRLDFHNKTELKELLWADIKTIKNIGEYYFAKEYFQEAAEIFKQIIETDKNGELYQKVAYCLEKSGHFEQAIEYYLKADLFDVNRLWNLKKIATCYRNLKNPSKALEYYREIEKDNPDDLNNQLNIGESLLEQKQFDEALKCYFKVEYLTPGNSKVWRPIAWCSFLTGKKQQAEKYYNKLIGSESNRYDYMNMGHVQWSIGNRKSALEYYIQSIQEKGFTEDEFMEIFSEDLPYLTLQGINKDDIPIMLDQLRYFLDGSTGE